MGKVDPNKKTPKNPPKLLLSPKSRSQVNNKSNNNSVLLMKSARTKAK